MGSHNDYHFDYSHEKYMPRHLGPLLLTHIHFYYNMTVWILARNYIISFHDSGLNWATYARCQVISCVTKASACHHTLHANHWHCLWKIPPIVAVKSNVTTSIQVLRFVVNMFYCGMVASTVFKYADIQGVRQRLTSTASLDEVRWQFPSLRGTTWRNNGRSAWNGSRFEH